MFPEVLKGVSQAGEPGSCPWRYWAVEGCAGLGGVWPLVMSTTGIASLFSTLDTFPGSDQGRLVAGLLQIDVCGRESALLIHSPAGPASWHEDRSSVWVPMWPAGAQLQELPPLLPGPELGPAF